jgi:hypothetical protein
VANKQVIGEVERWDAEKRSHGSTCGHDARCPVLSRPSRDATRHVAQYDVVRLAAQLQGKIQGSTA